MPDFIFIITLILISSAEIWFANYWYLDKKYFKFSISVVMAILSIAMLINFIFVR